MKRLPLLLLICLLPLPLYAVEVTILMKGLRSDKGTVIVGVYPDEKSFSNPKEAPYYNNKISIEDGKAEVTFDLPSGSYAVSMFHDENGNKKLDLNLARIPKEGWGFSRDARPSPRLPDFEDAAFEVAQEPVRLTINVRYGLF